MCQVHENIFWNERDPWLQCSLKFLVRTNMFSNIISKIRNQFPLLVFTNTFLHKHVSRFSLFEESEIATKMPSNEMKPKFRNKGPHSHDCKIFIGFT